MNGKASGVSVGDVELRHRRVDVGKVPTKSEVRKEYKVQEQEQDGRSDDDETTRTVVPSERKERTTKGFWASLVDFWSVHPLAFFFFFWFLFSFH